MLLLSLPLLLQPIPSTAQTGPPSLPTGQWYTYANGDDILALEVEGDSSSGPLRQAPRQARGGAQDAASTSSGETSGHTVIWAGTRAGGVVRWNTTDSSYVQFLKPQSGLAGNTVYDIAIDTHGHKWFATDGGLSVLDDNGTPDQADDIWYTYTQQSTDGGLPSNQVTAVALDEAGYVWVGSAQYWDPEAEVYVGGGLSQLDTQGTLEPGDDVWLHTYTLENTLTRRRGEVILGLASNNILDILPVPGNRIWVATRQHWLFEQPDENIPGQWVEAHGGLSRLDHAGTPETDDDTWETWNCEENSQFGCVVTQLRMDTLGYIWAAMRGRGVLVFQRDATVLRPDRDRFTTADGLETNFVDAIAFGPPGDPEWGNTVWFSTYQSLNGWGRGVSVLDHNGTPGNRRDDTWNDKNPVPGEPITTGNGLAGDRVQVMVAGVPSGGSGQGGVMWMGTGGVSGRAYGISRFGLRAGAFEDPLTTAVSGIASNYITAIAFGEAGTRWANQVWVGTGHRRERRYGVGALLLNTQGTLGAEDDTWSQFTKEGTDDDGQPPWTGLAGNNVVALEVDGNHVWFGTREATWDSSRREYTDGGLSVFDGDQWAIRTVENTGGESAGLHSNSVTALAVGCSGELWIGLGNLQDSTGAGIDVLATAGDPFNPVTDIWWDPFRSPPLPSNLITGIAPDCSRRQLWVSSAPYFTGARIQGGGVGAYSYETAQWTVYTKADGIQSYVETGITGDARSIAVGPDGTVWVGTWGTTDMSRKEVFESWPYVPAVVNWYRGGTWSHEVFEHDGWTSSIAVDATGSVWAGTSRGGVDSDQDGQEDREVRKTAGGIKLTRDGAEWLSLSPANSRLVSGDIEVIVVGTDGDVWIGTNGWGLFRFHPAEPTSPTPTSTSTPAPPSPTATGSPSSTPTGTETPAPSSPTATGSPSSAPTSTKTPAPSSPTATSSPSSTPTGIVTRQPATPTATPTVRIPRRVYLPMVVSNRAGHLPTGTATPSAGISPQFDCGGWCGSGSTPEMRQQTITSDRPVDDWRVYLDGWIIGILPEEAPTYAVIEAPVGSHVRVEALFRSEWLVACESDVECLLPTVTSSSTSTPTEAPPTETPTWTPSPTGTPSPTPTLTTTPTIRPTTTPSSTPTVTPTVTPTPEPPPTGVWCQSTSTNPACRQVNIPQFPERDLHDITFTDALNGFIVGEDGFIARTNDGGETWRWNTLGSMTLRGISMVDSRVGFIVADGETIFRTLDGGNHFLRMKMPADMLGRDEDFWSVYAFSANEAWALGHHDGVILYWDGQRWDFGIGIRWTGLPYTDLAMPAPDQGWTITADGYIYAYKGGWTESPLLRAAGPLRTITMYSPTEGWAAGDDGVLVRYFNGRWTESLVSGAYDGGGITGLHVHTPTDVWAAAAIGSDERADGAIYRYRGHQWEQVAYTYTAQLNDIWLDDTLSNGWAIGNNGLVMRYVISSH